MELEEVSITPVKPKGSLIAFAGVVYKGLYLGDIAVHRKLDGSGYRITFPTKKVGKVNLHIYHPTRSDVGWVIESAIIKQCHDLLDERFENNESGTTE